MNEIKIFENPTFGEIRIVLDENQEPLFCAIDVCKALGYSNGRDAITKHVEEDDVAKRDAIDSMGRIQQVTYVNEPGLYSLIFGSKMPDAKKFKHWVTSEVLPSIRKTGGYLAPSVSDDRLKRFIGEQRETMDGIERRIVNHINMQYEYNNMFDELKEAVLFTRNKVDYMWRNFDKLLTPGRPSHPAGKPVRHTQKLDPRMAGLSDAEILEAQYGMVIGIPDFARHLRYTLRKAVNANELEYWFYDKGYLSRDPERFGMPDGIAAKENYLVSTGRMWQGLCASFLTKEGEEFFTGIIKEEGGLK